MVIGIIFGVLLILVTVRGIALNKKRNKELETSFREGFGKFTLKDYSLQGKKHRKAMYKNTKSEYALDDITWNDLNMESIFERIDSCVSAAGEEYLYERLRISLNNPDSLDDFVDLVDYFGNREDDRISSLMILSKLGYVKNYSPYDYLKYITEQKVKSPVIDIVLNILFIPLIGLLFFKPLWAGVGIFVLLVVNIFLYFRKRAELEGNLACISFLVRLVEAGIKLERKNIDIINKDERFTKTVNILKPIKNNGNYLIASGKGNVGGSASSGPAEMILSYVNMVFHIDLINYSMLIEKLHGIYDELDYLIRLLGKLDAAISVAGFSKSLNDNVTKPEFCSDKRVYIVNGYHPLIKKPVCNTIDTTQGILITGSNASGKSTFLRMVAVNAIFAQTIGIVCAKEYKAPRFNIFSSIALKDNMFKGESYFMVEIKALKRILDACDGAVPVLCFVDEVLRGTNTVERLSAAKVLLESIAEKNAICFAATHDVELTKLLQDCYSNYHFSEEMSGEDISFNYKLLKGPSTTRNALVLLRKIGFSDEIIKNAEALHL